MSGKLDMVMFCQECGTCKTVSGEEFIISSLYRIDRIRCQNCGAYMIAMIEAATPWIIFEAHDGLMYDQEYPKTCANHPLVINKLNEAMVTYLPYLVRSLDQCDYIGRDEIMEHIGWMQVDRDIIIEDLEMHLIELEEDNVRVMKEGDEARIRLKV